MAAITIIGLTSFIGFGQIKENQFNNQRERLDKNNPTHQELLRIAQLAVDTDVQLEMFDESQVKSKDDPQFAAAMQKRFEGSKRVYKGIVEQNLTVATEYKNTFSNLKYKINGDSATLFATQHETKFYPGKNQKLNADEVIAKSHTATGWIEHQFEFRLQNGIWILIKDFRVNDDSENPNLQQSDSTINWSIISEQTTKGISEDMLFNLPETQQSLTSDNVSRANIIRYAYTYFHYNNPNYREFTNDCTNFTSQCLFAGGWSMIGDLPDRNSVAAWYYFGQPYNYPPFTSLQSLTWDKAENFRDFAFLRNDKVTRVDPKELIPGDILQVKWNEVGNPGYHSMVITKISPDGDPLFTQHSINFADRSFAELASRYPSAIWYAWHLKVANEINITGINPNPLRISQGQGNGAWLTVTGSNFRQGLTASVNQWQIANSGVRWVNSNTVQVWVAMNNNRRVYTLQLKNPDGSIARKNFSVVS